MRRPARLFSRPGTLRPSRPGCGSVQTELVCVNKRIGKKQQFETIMMTRRTALKNTVLAATACAVVPALTTGNTFGAEASGSLSLPPLPYPADALEPHIDARTMEIHHGKHHAAYVSNLSKALADLPEWNRKSVDEIVRTINSVPEKVRTTVRNNGGGHYNHSLFWPMMTRNAKKQPSGELSQAIDRAFGNFSAFKEKFTEAATKVFGSGWAWLVLADGGRLAIESTANQDNPLMFDSAKTPVLGLDVWEHAYYLKYQNRRADYINAWFNVVNWDYVSERFAKADR